MQIRYVLNTCLALVGTVIAASDASAASDSKYYPGATCRPVSGSGGTVNNWFGTMHNSSTSTALDVICPLIHDAQSISNVEVRLFHRNANTPFSCTLFSEWANGSTVTHYSETLTLNTGDLPYHSLLFNQTANSFPSGDYYYLTCSIPKVGSAGQSAIIDIKVIENS
jgi:hypothetical protein